MYGGGSGSISGCEAWPQLAQCIEQPENSFLQRARERGDRCIGYTCSFIPEALLSVPGLVPVRAFAHGVTGTEMADVYLSNVLCSYTRSLLEYALEYRYEHLDGWVFAASCDHLRRLYDNLVYLTRPAFAHILDLPHKKGDAALDWYYTELCTLAEHLTETFGVDTGPEALRTAMHSRERTLGILREIGDLRTREHPPISGTEFHALIRAAAVVPDADAQAFLTPIRDDIMARDGIEEYRARLMVVGSEFDSPDYLDVIESTGGLVVADRHCTGSLPGLEEIHIPEGTEPLRALAEHKLRRTTCPRMMEDFAPRVGEILAYAERFSVEGVIVESMKFCDLWSVEAVPLCDALGKAGIPFLRVEREYLLSGEGQLRTRVQAFLERLGR